MDSRQLVCKFCGKNFQNKSFLEIHLSEHAKEHSYVCSLCEKSFNNSNDFNNHLEVHSSALRSNENRCLSDGYQTDNESENLAIISKQDVTLNQYNEETEELNVNEQNDVKEEKHTEEFLDNESVYNADESHNLSKETTQSLSIECEGKENIKSLNDEDEKEFLDSIPIGDAKESLNFVGDINDEISEKAYNPADIKEEKEEFLDNNSDSNETNHLLERANNQLPELSDSSKTTSLLGHAAYDQLSEIEKDEQESVDNEFLLEDTNNEDQVFDTVSSEMKAKHLMEISQTNFTNNEYLTNTAKSLKIAQQSDNMADLLTEYVCELCFKSFAQLHHLKTHLSVHAKEKQHKAQKSKVAKVDNLKDHDNNEASEKIVKRVLRSTKKLEGLAENHQKTNEQKKNSEENFSSKTKKVDTLEIVKNSSNQTQQKQGIKDANTPKRMPKRKVTQIDNKCAICNKVNFKIRHWTTVLLQK